MRLFLRFRLYLLLEICFLAGISSTLGQGFCGSVVFSQNFDDVTAPALPAGWTASQGVNSGDPLWVTSTLSPFTASNDAFSPAPSHQLDNRLDSSEIFESFGPLKLYFRNNYDLENGFDGGVLEVSASNINGGAFTDITDPAVGAKFIAGGYDAPISTAFQSPIAGRMAWTGNSSGYIWSIVYLGDNLVGQTFVLRFRMGSDNGGSAGSWRVDNIAIQLEECPPPASPTPSSTPCGAKWSVGPVLPASVVHSVGIYFPENGRFYVMGGRNGETAGSDSTHPFEYDPTSNTWTTKGATFADAQVSDMACGVLTDAGTSYIYCVGGSAAGATTAAARTFRYNPVTDVIEAVAAPWPGNAGHDTLPGGFAVVQNKLYVLGGFQINTAMTDKIWQFTPGTNVWVQKNAVLPAALGFIPTTVVGNDIVMAGGSWFTPPDTLENIANVCTYEPFSDTTYTPTSLPHVTGETRAVTVNGRLWVLGGGRTDPDPSAEVDILDPILGWITGPPLATGRRNFAAASDGSRIWLGGGCATDCPTPLNSIEIFQCPGGSTPAPSVTPTATPTPSPTATPTASPTPSTTPIPTPTATPTPTAPAQSLNLSSRMLVQAGDRVGIAGLIISGSAPKRVIVRAVHCMICIPEVSPLTDPELELHGPNGFATIINDNWRDAQEAEIIATGLAPDNNSDPAIVVTLPPGNYTAVVRGKNNTSGVAVVEVYDLNQAAASKLANISTRAFVNTGGEILIAGFILGNGTMSDNLIVRGIGPSLTGLGVPDGLANPTLELRDSQGALIRANDNWMDDPVQKALIMAAGLAPTNPLESAIAETLPPGQYTALLDGVNNGTGNGLVEVYDLGP
jgi:hypothetical protein